MKNILTLTLCEILVLSVFLSTGSPSSAGTGSAVKTVVVPVINVAPQEIDFGRVLVGSGSDGALTIRNDGNTPLTIQAINVTSGPFRIISPTGSFRVNAGRQETVRIRFSPTAPSRYSGSLQINSDDPKQPVLTLPLRGVGVEELAADDGTFETALGFASGGSLYCVNRLTPPSYPATLTDVVIRFFDLADAGLFVGDPLTILVGVNPLQGGLVGGIEFKALETTIRSITEPNVYDVPDLTITAGEFVVGFKMTKGSEFYPCSMDENSGSQRRSYVSLDGLSFTLIDELGFPGNFGVRARITRSAREPVANVSPDELHFGCIRDQAKELPVTIRNGGDGTLSIGSIESTNPAFSLPGLSLPLVIAPGGQQTVIVRYTSPGQGWQEGKLTIRSNDPVRPLIEVFLTGGGGLLTVAEGSGAPGSLVAVAVNLNEGACFAALQFTLTYDPAVLALPDTQGVVAGTLVPSDFSITSRTTAPGQVVILITAPLRTPLPTLLSGSGSVAVLRFWVASNASPGTTTRLRITQASGSDSKANGIPLSTRDGGFTVRG